MLKLKSMLFLTEATGTVAEKETFGQKLQAWCANWLPVIVVLAILAVIAFLVYRYVIKLFTLTKSTIATKFDKIKKYLNFQKFSPHMLRHTFATVLIENNANINFVKELMGHSNVATTERYLHPSKKNYRKLYDQCMA